MVNIQPTLENDLVLVRPLRIADFEALYEVAKDPLIWKLHQNPDRWKIEVFRDFFREALESKGAFVIIDKATKGIIGSSRFARPKNSQEAIEIGWTFLSRAYWGGMFNKSFKSLMIKYSFEHVDYVLFHVDHHNYRSQKAVQKLGGELLDKKGSLGYLHTPKETGLTYILYKTANT